MDVTQVPAQPTSVVLASVLLITLAFAQTPPACNDHAITADVYKGRFFSRMTISNNITMKNLATSSVYGCNEACWRLTECIAISYNMSYIGEGNCKLFNLTRFQKHMEAASESAVILQLPMECNENSTEDGSWTSWSAVGQCNSTCGGGMQLMERSCTQPSPRCNGNFCDGEPLMYQSCNSSPCPVVNVALGKTCDQSSTRHSAPCERAIDGNPNPDYAGGSCTHTTTEVNPWWRVDLGRSYAVINVTVVNRQETSKSRLDNFDIRVGNSLDENGNLNQICVSGVQFDPEIVRTFECVPPLTGRYVNVQIIHQGQALTLCEVIVMAM